jgi:DNA-binding transcriptional LysR family regulator
MSYSVEDLRLFALVSATGNLSQAARELDLLPATASAAIKRLEARLEARLFERSTRHMRLTPQGEMFLDYCRDALVLLEQGEALLGASAGRIRGKLRVAAPADWGRNVLAPMLDPFLRKHSGLTVILQCDDRSTDLFRDPVDLAFRYGRLEDASFVSQQLAENRRVAVASPAYLKKRGTPATPEDLPRHNCLVHSMNQGTSNTWRFSKGRKQIEVTVHGDRVADDGGLVREWAVAGVGIAYKSHLDVAADLAAGRLVALFPELLGADWPLHAVYPHRNSLGPAARALLAHVAAHCVRARTVDAGA